MKKTMNSTSKLKLAFISGVVMCFGAAFVFLNENSVKAELSGAGLRHFAIQRATRIPALIERSGSPWINLKQGEPINSDYVGKDSAISRFESGSLSPTTLTATDFDFDGHNDVISGYAGANGGVITLHRGSKEAFAPEDPQVLAGIRNGNFPVSFEKQSKVIEVPVSPDFIVAGNFVKDSFIDLIVASRGGSSIFVFSSDGYGSFGSPREFTLGGAITALAADRFAASKVFTGLTVATETDGGQLVIFDGSSDINTVKTQRVSLGKAVSSLILTSPDRLNPDRDLFILADGEISRIPQIGKGNLDLTRLDLPFRVEDFATGEFIRDRRAKTEIAALADDGSVYYLRNGSLDLRPFTESEMRAAFAKYGRGRNVVLDSNDSDNALANNWTIAEAQNLGVFNLSKQGSPSLLRKSYITGNETEDLLVINPNENKIQILFKEPNYEPNRSSFTGGTQVENVTFAGGISAALPVRLNVMGQQGIAVLESGKLEPTPLIFAPSATFTVTKTADTNDGACNADCSVREAVVAANGAAGADLITFTPNGNFQLTIGASNENAGASGDLDVLQALTITGNGSANTFLQGGASVGTGIDKVLSINPNFNAAFATSITGVTVRFGRNQGTFSGDGFGGGFDWEGSGTGTLSVANSIITDNRSTDGDGGGVTITNSVAGAGNTTFTGTTISNNVPARIGAASPLGGAIFVGTATHFALSNVTISGNNVNGSSGVGEGGGVFAFGPGGSFGLSSIANTTFSGNAAPLDGGGLRTTQIITFTAPLTFSSNTAGRWGGGLWNSVGAGNTTTISKATFSGNSATSNGGGIYSFTGNLNVSFSRFAGNTGGGSTGLGVDTSAGAATVINNWWGCNAGPSFAPCNRASATAPGTVNFTPWIVLRHIASPTSRFVGETSTLTADFLRDSAGGTIAASNLDAFIGVPISFGSAVNGSLSAAQTTIQASGTATATFTATAVGTGTANATVDAQIQPLATSITINPTTTATTPGCTGLAPSPLVASTTNKAVLCFTLTANSSVNFTALNVPFTTAPNTRFTNAKLFRSTDNDYSTAGDNTLVSSGTINATQFSFTGFSAFQGIEPSIPELSTTPTNFFVVADILGTVTLATPASQASVAPANITVSSGNLTGATATGTNYAFAQPTAASVSVAGRVLTADGRGINRVRVSLTGSNGQIRTATSNSFGYYRFENIEAGSFYTIMAFHKEFLFNPQLIDVSDEIAGLDIIAQN